MSDAAVRYAVEQAAWCGVGLVAIHAWRWPVPQGPGDMVPVVHDEAALRAEAERAVVESLAGCRDRYPDTPIEARLVRGGAAQALIERSAYAGLTVVGSRGRGGFTGLLLGSVSQQVLHHAWSPVAVVRPD